MKENVNKQINKVVTPKKVMQKFGKIPNLKKYLKLLASKVTSTS